MTPRYPTAKPAHRYLVIVLALTLFLVGGSWLVWTAWIHSHPSVSARVNAFEISSDQRVKAQISVERNNPTTPAQCFVYAQAKSFERVGEKWVSVSSGPKVMQLSVELATFRRATTVVVDKCELR